MKQIRLALSGSGFLAPVHAGAICAFLDKGIQIIEVAGTSGGSIAASLLACGMTSIQIKNAALRELPRGIDSYNLISVLLLRWRQGLNKGTILKTWLRRLLMNTSLGTAKIPITIMATDIDNGVSFKFNAKETSNVLLSDACRASASVPIIYVPAEVRGIKFTDGGMCCNIPVDQLVQDNIPRFGIEVMDGTPAGSTKMFEGLLKQCLSTMLASNEANLTAWAEQTGTTIIPVDATPYGFLNASLTLTQKTELFQRGYDAVIKCLNPTISP
jgi:NTE family protein